MLWIGNCIQPSGHTAEVISQVCLKVIEKWNSLRSPEKVIYKLAANIARTHTHRCRREPPQEILEGAIPWLTNGAQDPSSIYEQAILLEELLNQLNESDQSLFSFLFEGWTFEEIAVALDTPSGTLRSRYKRAVEKLKQANSPKTDNYGYDPLVAITD
jgi:RNA polymerase sigma factor (sigma-70 family)